MSSESVHVAGVAAVRETVRAARDLGISILTLYAFSSENWKRPVSETSHLMGLMRNYLNAELPRLAESDCRLRVIGRRDRLPPDLVAAIAEVERVTATGTNFTLRIAVDYSARHAILAAAASLGGHKPPDADAFSRHLSGTGDIHDVDLLIRTSGEQRLSDFLLWECAQAELYFTDCLWPDFSASDLTEALDVFWARDRRFGGLSEPSRCSVDSGRATTEPSPHPQVSAGVR
ncbi:MAG: polyprenyl diphosphate synthase [Pseudomonadota bacterium]